MHGLAPQGLTCYYARMNIFDALNHAGSKNALAKILGVTRQAIQSYCVSGLPQARVEQLKQLRPEWFRKATV
jgi:hypothetical protein